MDNEIEDKIISLQICIDEGHRYVMDKDSLDGNNITLSCTTCEYSKTVELAKEQVSQIDKLFDDESSLQEAILKNES